MNKSGFLINVILLAFLMVYLESCEEESAPVLETSEITDERDGNTYKTVKIGTRWWMAENLKFVPEDYTPDGSAYIEPYYYIHGYMGEDFTEITELDNYKEYGVLYNWPAAKCSCPRGWHLPSDEEWKEMEISLGMSPDAADNPGFRGSDEGDRLKSETGWAGNGNGNNFSGFTALPGGNFSTYYEFSLKDYFGYWWTSSPDGNIYAWARKLYYNQSSIDRRHYVHDYAFSVRCIKDQE